MARSSECTEQYAQKVFDSADIVREAMLRQLMGHYSMYASSRVTESAWSSSACRSVKY